MNAIRKLPFRLMAYAFWPVLGGGILLHTGAFPVAKTSAQGASAILRAPTESKVGPAILWTEPEPINANPLDDDVKDEYPRLTADETGHWLIVWDSFVPPTKDVTADRDVRYVFSLDGAASWSVPSTLNGTVDTDGGRLDWFPVPATDGLGNWIVVWESFEDVDLPYGHDSDILFARASNNDFAWSGPEPLNSAATTDWQNDSTVHLTADESGDWLAVWMTDDNVPEDPGLDLLVSRIENGGASWSIPQLLDVNAESDSTYEYDPRLATDRAGNWVSVWSAEGVGIESDLFVSHSSNTGSSWRAPTFLNADGATDASDDWQPQIATDGAGHWIAVWYASNRLDGATGLDSDIFVARSIDNGETWTSPANLNTTALSDSANDYTPQIATDGYGNWLVCWTASGDGKAVLGPDPDVLFAHSGDNGATWTTPLPIDADASIDLRDDINSQVATDTVGNWVVVWEGKEPGNSSSPWKDGDVLLATAKFTTDVSVRLIDNNTSRAIDAAVVRVASLDGGIERIALSDATGRLTLKNLPLADYTVQAFARGYATKTESLSASSLNAIDVDVSMQKLQPSNPILTGTVIDSTTESPLGGVLIYVQDGATVLATTYTSFDGEYEIESISSIPKTFTVQVHFHAYGFHNSIVEIAVTPGATTNVNAELAAILSSPGSLSGIVQDSETNEPLSEARVIATRSMVGPSTSTGVDGAYAMGALEAGQWIVCASAPGYISQARKCAVRGGDPSFSADFVLVVDPDSLHAPADINDDTTVDAVDVQLVINGALNLNTGFDCDVNGDTHVDAVDVQLVINAALGL